MASTCYTPCAPSTKFVFNRSKDIKGVPKFQDGSGDPSHAPLGVNFSSADKGSLGGVQVYRIWSTQLYPCKSYIEVSQNLKRDRDHVHFRG